ncbi:hypothetical protein [Lentzea jiangxiensis]|uniref:hypothetical protein n=1 Tax=Lentzea jiangxiensis TaxID=641025 RepID=UPI00115FD31B|nr:hypothetical protein [Lentzea jiangxiensis]
MISIVGCGTARSFADPVTFPGTSTAEEIAKVPPASTRAVIAVEQSMIGKSWPVRQKGLKFCDRRLLGQVARLTVFWDTKSVSATTAAGGLDAT